VEEGRRVFPIVAIAVVCATVAAALVAVLGGGRSRLAAVVGLGVVLAVAFVGVVSVAAPTHRPARCSDCGLYGGRYWEPWFVSLLAAVGLVGWVAGGVIGVARGAWMRRERHTIA
jgi:hypothetical protein